MWAKDDECTNIINDVWASNPLDGSLREVMDLIKNCSARLTWLNKTNFRHIQ